MTLPLISVIFITYNRAHTLVATFETFLAMTDYPRDRLELIISDDASDRHNSAIIETLAADKLVRAKRNSGLGANCNRGIAAARGEYLFQLQDDWITIGNPQYLRIAVAALAGNPDIGMITFRPRPDLDSPTRRAFDGDVLQILRPRLNSGGSIDSVADGIYTDNPHLKRRNFHDIVGRYEERIAMTRMELAMSRAVLRHPHMQVAFIEGLEVFRHIGSADTFNPGALRNRRIEAIARLPGGNFAIEAIRRVRRLVRSQAAKG